MTIQLGRINKALHALLASAGTGIIADAVTRLHSAAQAGGLAAGAAALATAAVSWAAHSRTVDHLAHQVELDASKVIGPGLVAQVEKVIADDRATIAAAVDQVAAIPEVSAAVAAVRARVEEVASSVPAPVKVAVEDIRPLVESILAEKFTPNPAPAPAIVPAPTPAPIQTSA